MLSRVPELLSSIDGDRMCDFMLSAGLIENMTEFRSEMCTDAAQQGLMTWLLRRLRVSISSTQCNISLPENGCRSVIPRVALKPPYIDSLRT